MSCPNGFSQILWFRTNPLVAHDMGSKDAVTSLMLGGTDYQSDFVVGFQPHPRFTVPASSLSKQFFRLEDNLIPYDEVCCPGQLV